MPTLEDLDKTVNELMELTEELRRRLYPNDKPNWMPQEQWNEIIGEATEED